MFDRIPPALLRRLLFGLTIAVGVVVVLDCGSGDDPSIVGHSDGGGKGKPDGGGPDLALPAGVFADLPSAPVMAGGLSSLDPAALAAAFSAAGSGGGPCLSEPSLDAMFPRNFTPPVFEWIAAGGDDVFELRVHADNQLHDLVVYTDQLSYTPGDAAWAGLCNNSAGHDLTVTIRSGRLVGAALASGPHLGATGPLHISPVPARGAVLYWTTTGGSAIKGFQIGDKTVKTLITPELMRAAQPGDTTQCVGCHVSSPDGNLAFVGRGPNKDGGPFGIDARVVTGDAARGPTSAVSPDAIRALLRPFQVMPALSESHYSAADAVAVSLYNGGVGRRFDLLWTDLHTGASGLMARTGDPGQADSPSFSHDGESIVYTSSDGAIAIYQDPANTDVYTVPYNARQGGAAAPLVGASDPLYNEYYPVYSPGDGLVAFNRIPAGREVYNARDAEIFVVSSGGGIPTRIAANDPPACTGMVSPGITNSWPHWSPELAEDGGKRYYWMVFSTRRRAPQGGQILPQLYLAAVVTSTGPGGERLEKTYPAVYITTQVPTEANHTPAWDVFQIQPPS